MVYQLPLDTHLFGLHLPFCDGFFKIQEIGTSSWPVPSSLTPVDDDAPRFGMGYLILRLCHEGGHARQALSPGRLRGVTGLCIDDPAPTTITIEEKEIGLEPVRFAEIIGLEVEASVIPALEDFGDEKVLENGAPEGARLEGLRVTNAREVADKARVPEVELRPLYEPLADVRLPGAQAENEVARLTVPLQAGLENAMPVDHGSG
jgi:hypothetical protein